MLVVIEIALTIIVTAGAGLMLQTLNHLRRVDPGFNADKVVTLQFNLPAARYQTPESRVAFVDRILAVAHSLPS